MTESVRKSFGGVPRETLGTLLGLFGVAGFSLTLPATRMAVEHLDPTLVGLGRSLVAGALAAILLLVARQPMPSPSQIKSLGVTAAGVIAGFPLLSSWSMQQLPAAHAAIVIAVLPLLTAIAGAIRMKERPSLGFWLASLAGSALVLAFVIISGGKLQMADGVLVLASLAAAAGYAEGGRLAKSMGGWQVICWALVLAAPFLTVPVGIAILRHGINAPPESWLGFAYVSLVSQLFAFILWYQAMALCGVVRTSQIQLLQPFMTLGAAAALLGERITPAMVVFSTAIVGVIVIGRKMPITKAGTIDSK